jgi:hypothetical protein
MFKKLIVTALLIFASTAHADRNWHHNNYYRSGNNYGWVAPAIIGSAVVYGLTRPYYVAPPPVVYAPQPVYIQQPNPAYAPPLGYHWDTILDGNCNCYKTVLVPN